MSGSRLGSTPGLTTKLRTHISGYHRAPQGNDPFHDCWFQSDTPMPTAAWTCVEFSMDSVSRELRMKLDGSTTPIAAVDDTGQGCVGNVPGDSLWYGPAVDEIYVGAWSFHVMEGPLDVWIDDLVVDTEPVLCPAP